MTYDTIAIVGVGLIGGSIGLAARKRGLAGEVVGVGRREAGLQAALEIGAVTRTTTDLSKGVRSAEIVVVCTPIDDVAQLVRQAVANNETNALITDAGSTKAAIVAELERTLPPGVRFVGSHPMAGSHASGPAEADADLFVDRAVIVTPTSLTSEDDVQDVSRFWSALGANVVTMSPSEHDRAVAAVSHVPHLVAANLVNSVPADDLPLAAGGLRDATRIALGDAELWKQIVLSNRREIQAALSRFQGQMDLLHAALEAGDAAGIQDLLSKARELRRGLE